MLINLALILNETKPAFIRTFISRLAELWLTWLRRPRPRFDRIRLAVRNAVNAQVRPSLSNYERRREMFRRAHDEIKREKDQNV